MSDAQARERDQAHKRKRKKGIRRGEMSALPPIADAQLVRSKSPLSARNRHQAQRAEPLSARRRHESVVWSSDLTPQAASRLAGRHCLETRLNTRPMAAYQGVRGPERCLSRG
jgi:hypothetical protein